MMIALSVSVLVVVAAVWTPLRRSRVVFAVGSSLVVVGFVALLVVGSRWMYVPLGIAVALTAVTVALRVKGVL